MKKIKKNKEENVYSRIFGITFNSVPSRCKTLSGEIEIYLKPMICANCVERKSGWCGISRKKCRIMLALNVIKKKLNEKNKKD